MKLDGIATFVAVAEAGSISEAARRLRLSKSVVSERLAELERSLGASLMHRTTRKLTLTEDGAAFLERAARIARDVEDAAAEFAERRGGLAGPLRLSAPVTFGRHASGAGALSLPGAASGDRADPRSRRPPRRCGRGRLRRRAAERADRGIAPHGLAPRPQPAPPRGLAGLSRTPWNAGLPGRARGPSRHLLYQPRHCRLALRRAQGKRRPCGRGSPCASTMAT